jgi:hypothetical protein
LPADASCVSRDVCVKTCTRPVGGSTDLLAAAADEDPFACGALSDPDCRSCANAAGAPESALDESVAGPPLCEAAAVCEAAVTPSWVVSAPVVEAWLEELVAAPAPDEAGVAAEDPLDEEAAGWLCPVFVRLDEFFLPPFAAAEAWLLVVTPEVDEGPLLPWNAPACPFEAGPANDPGGSPFVEFGGENGFALPFGPVSDVPLALSERRNDVESVCESVKSGAPGRASELLVLGGRSAAVIVPICVIAGLLADLE